MLHETFIFNEATKKRCLQNEDCRQDENDDNRNVLPHINEIRQVTFYLVEDFHGAKIVRKDFKMLRRQDVKT